MGLAEPMVMSSFFHFVVDNLKERKFDPKILLEKCEVPLSCLEDPYREMPLRKYIQFLEEAAVFSGDQNFGLGLGRRATPFSLGPLGLLFASSANLSHALQGLATHVGVVQDRTNSALRLDGEMAAFHYRIDDPRIRQRRQDAEFSLGMICQLVRYVAGKNWAPEEVHFEHPAPAATSDHAALFRAPIYFDQPTNAVILRRSDLGLRNPQVDEKMALLFQHHVAVMRGQRSDRRNLSDQVRSIVRDHFPAAERSMTATRAAEATGLSARTLQRVLQREQTGFRAIKDEERKQIAHQYLLQTRMPVTEIALMLGYSDPACFTRACRRWFGVNPRKLRQESGVDVDRKVGATATAAPQFRQTTAK